MSIKTFQLHRDYDVSGISGTGIVADGAVFPDGVTVVRWRGERQSTVVWPTVDDVEAIHGHGGATRIVWDGDPARCQWAVDMPTLGRAATPRLICTREAGHSGSHRSTVDVTP